MPPKKVFVGMSGGVDSSVSAGLLKRAGFDVTGVFIKVWYPDFFTCNWKEERRDAMRVSAKLGIPFITLDLSEKYKNDVVDYMINSYKAGITPNPDVMCNRAVKFGGFLDFAKKNGADFVATGHYARKARIDSVETLRTSKDKDKDQTYFLWKLNSEDLSKIIFPVGDMTKNEVRKMARNMDLPVSDKKDSQGLCFIGKIGMKEFLSHYVEERAGDVLNFKGVKIGTHNGAMFYTEGERHGFVIDHKYPNEEPYYVVKRDLEKNTITVARQYELLKQKKEIELIETNWVIEPEESKNYGVRMRYRQKLVNSRISKKDDRYFLITDGNEEIPASGQSAVVYNNDIVIGGGIIKIDNE